MESDHFFFESINSPFQTQNVDVRRAGVKMVVEMTAEVEGLQREV